MIGVGCMEAASSSRSHSTLMPFHALVADLNARRAWVYWLDFSASAAGGYLAFAVAGRGGSLGLAALLLTISTFLLYRAAVFTHELAHMSQRSFRAFRLTWNLTCGIPLLIPSFLYEIHAEHHDRHTYGSEQDGEYLAFATLPRSRAALFVMSSFVAVPAVVVRFLVLGPLSWIVRPLRATVLSRVSALVIDGEYRRRLPAAGIPRRWLVQEVACFGWCLLLTATALTRVVHWTVFARAYAVLTSILLINAFRTLAAHRYEGDGSPMSLDEQVLDSNNFAHGLAALWAPVGLRYHAIHHMFPNLPYHSLGEAHRRIVAHAPVLHRTHRRSIVDALYDLLFRRSRTNRAA